VLAEEANDAREVLHIASFQMPRSEGLMRPSGTTAVASVSTVACPANGASAQVDEMPVVGQSRLRWSTRTSEKRDAVTKMNIANLECVEQIHGLWMISGGDAVQSTSSIGTLPLFGRESSLISTFHWTQLDVTLFSNAEASKDPVENVVARVAPVISSSGRKAP